MNSLKLWAIFDITHCRYWGTPIPVWISEDGEEQVLRADCHGSFFIFAL